MKILLVQDEGVNTDLSKCANILNGISNTVNFEHLKGIVSINPSSSNVEFIKEVNLLSEELSEIKRDYVIHITFRKYPDNFFYHAIHNTMILSFFGWKNYTNLPLENGLFYFISHALALRIDRNSNTRHLETTGCVYDFLSNKTAVDVGMKMGYICEGCLPRIKEKTKKTGSFANILIDLMEILTVLSNASRLGKSVIKPYQTREITRLNWSTFEDEVSGLYRQIGVKVKQNVNLAGFQIDLLVEEETQSKQKILSAIEIKFYDKKLGNRIVNDFARIVQTLKDSRMVDKGIIVSYSGFSQDAFLVSEKTGIELLHYNDLKQMAEKTEKLLIKETEKTPEEILEKKLLEVAKRKERSPKIFVLMPFSHNLNDLYYLGILETARKLNCHCERVDKIEFTGSIMEKINESIINARVIIAEVTSQNLNVYYEVGYAHALNKSTILITKDVSTAPFDLSGYNHIVYEDIRDLKTKLGNRLKAILVDG